MTTIVCIEKCSEPMYIFSEQIHNVSEHINIFSELKHNIFLVSLSTISVKCKRYYCEKYNLLFTEIVKRTQPEVEIHLLHSLNKTLTFLIIQCLTYSLKYSSRLHSVDLSF